MSYPAESRRRHEHLSVPSQKSSRVRHAPGHRPYESGALLESCSAYMRHPAAPYGIPALEVLKNEGIYDEIKDKLVFGESISQTNQFITSEVAEVGFTAKSVVLSPNIKENDNWIEMNINSYRPIAQGVVILKNRNDHREDAQKFYEFLLSKKAGKILIKFGYALNNK